MQYNKLLNNLAYSSRTEKYFPFVVLCRVLAALGPYSVMTSCKYSLVRISTPPWKGCYSIAGLPTAIKYASTHLYSWVERGTVRVECPPRAQTQTARFGDKDTNHETTLTPTTTITTKRTQKINFKLFG